MKHCTLILLMLACSIIEAYGQIDSTVYQLDEVMLSDGLLNDFSIGQNLIKIDDSMMVSNTPLLTTILNQQTTIYFKQNGLGMVSSPSFRGTTASQTAVLWNGININSSFNGQLDFNTVNAGNFENIQVRAGGGSLVYGTGAIGGTVHLNNALHYNSEWENSLHLKYGSFDTRDLRYKSTVGGKYWATTVSLVRFSSDNDYDYPHSDNYNRNGQFENTGLNASLAFKLNQTHSLRFYSQLFQGTRHFALIRPSENKTKYKDYNYRNLLEWRSDYGRFESRARLAFLAEEYRYFANIKNDRYSFGKAKTAIGKYNATYKFSKTQQLTGILSFNSVVGKGSNIAKKRRNIGALAVLWKEKINAKWAYEVGGRKEVTSDYDSPFLFNIGTEYQLAGFYKLKLNASKNFRIPTFNDLYWSGNGNVDLKPETSHQFELGNQFSGKQWHVTATGFFNSIDNLIQWLPQSSGLWQPENRENVHTYGAEIYTKIGQNFGKHHLQFNGNYSYSVSKNQKNDKQLIYVPFHKATANAKYGYGRFFMNYHWRFIGEVFTRSDNDPDNVLSSYALYDLGLGYHFGQHQQLTAGMQLNNIFDKYYQNVEDRAMPGIHFNFYLTLTL